MAADIGVKANALRVVPANDITDGTYLGDIKFGESLPANTNTQEVVGDVAENENAAGNPVLFGGRYDSSPRTLGNTDVGAIALAVDGAVHVDDGGNSITVDQGTASNLKCEEASGSAIKSAVEIMDDWDATHASASSADGPQIMGAGYSTGLPTDVGADADAARICTDRYGRILRGIMPQWFNAVYDSADASGEGETVKAKTASRKIYILSLTISVDAEMWVKLQDEDSNAITPKHWFKAGGGKTITYPPEAPLVLNVANKDLEVITEGAGNIGVEVTGYLAP